MLVGDLLDDEPLLPEISLLAERLLSPFEWPLLE